MLDFDFNGLRERGQAIVYLLSDPRPDRLECYVGQTISPKRFKEHLKAPEWSTTEGKAKWIAELKSLCLDFNIDVIEICSKDQVDDRERFWIGRYEHSPHHILMNGLMDRAIFSDVIPDDSVIDLLRRKPNFLAKIVEFREIWCYFMSRERVLINGFHQGYRLLREKVAFACTQSAFEESAQCSPRAHWERTLGARDYALMRRGITGMYTERTAVAEGAVRVALTDYVQWAVKTRLGYQTVEQYRVSFNESLGRVKAVPNHVFVGRTKPEQPLDP